MGARALTIMSNFGMWGVPKFPGRNFFVAFSLLLLWWLISMSIAYSSTELPARMFWGQFAWLGIAGVPVSWVLFLWAYTRGRDVSWTNGAVLLGALLVVVIWVAALTNDFHRLMYPEVWYEVSPDGSGEKSVMFSYGVLWKLSTGVCYAALAGAIGLLARAIWNSASIYRLQYLGLLFVTIIPGSLNFAYLYSPAIFRGSDMTLISFMVIAGILIGQVGRHQLFSLLPIATTALIDAIEDPVLVVDRRGIVVRANKAVQTIPGAPLDVVGERVQVLPQLVDFLNRRVGSGVGGNDLDVGDRSYEVHGTLLSYAEREVGVLLVLRDVTQRKMFEQKLLDAKLRAEEALDTQRQVLREQRNLLSMIAHEFRTPMTIIDSAIQLIGDYDRGDDVDTEIEKISRAIHRMAELISTCLAEDWLRTPGARLRMREVDLTRIVGDVCNEIHIRAPGRVLYRSSEPLWVSCDPSMMAIAVTNLIDNALKYSKQDELVDVWVRVEGEQARIEVADRGAGVASDEREKIFEKYYRSPRATETMGAGLGLYLVRGIVSMHRGRIWVEQREGGGAIFSILLPIVHERNQSVRELNRRAF